MPSIITPVTELVKTKLNSTILSLERTKPRTKTQEEISAASKDINVLFMGTPDFAVPILEELIKSDFRPKAVITAPDKPVGRGQTIAPPPVKIIAQKNQISIFQPATRQELVAETLKIKPDLIVAAAYGKILPKEILDIPKYGSINVHPSLLPKYRGPSPIQFAILNGDEQTGTAIMLMNERMDEGPILAQQIVKIDQSDTAQTLEQKLSKISAKLLIKTLNQWVVLKEIPEFAQKLIYPQQQDNTKATYTKILTKHDGKIIWSKSAKDIKRQARAFYPWPGSFSILKTADGKSLSLKIISTDVSNIQSDKELGQVFLTQDQRLAVQTGSDCLILNELQLEGGKPMSAQNFLNGHPEIVGAILQ